MQLETRCFSQAAGWSAPLPLGLDSGQTLVLAFAAPSFAETPGTLRDLRVAFPRSQVLGCSTAGEIHHARLTDETIVIAVARFDSTSLRTVSAATGPGRASFDAGARIARSLAGPDLRAILVLSEGLDVNGSELVRGINPSARATSS